MTTLINTAKHNASLTGVLKPSGGLVFFGWLFWFTQPTYGDALVNVAKNTAAITNVPKH